MGHAQKLQLTVRLVRLAYLGQLRSTSLLHGKLCFCALCQFQFDEPKILFHRAQLLSILHSTRQSSSIFVAHQTLQRQARIGEMRRSKFLPRRNCVESLHQPKESFADLTRLAPSNFSQCCKETKTKKAMQLTLLFGGCTVGACASSICCCTRGKQDSMAISIDDWKNCAVKSSTLTVGESMIDVIAASTDAV